MTQHRVSGESQTSSPLIPSNALPTEPLHAASAQCEDYFYCFLHLLKTWPKTCVRPGILQFASQLFYQYVGSQRILNTNLHNMH